MDREDNFQYNYPKIKWQDRQTNRYLLQAAFFTSNSVLMPLMPQWKDMQKIFPKIKMVCSKVPQYFVSVSRNRHNRKLFKESFVCFLDYIFSAVLSSQQNYEEDTEISHVSSAPIHT